MKYYYDFHIHTCLSPCASSDMTPMNIVGMAKLTGLDVIAAADHNSIGNVRALRKASLHNDGPLVIPAMELETSENIHVLMLFRDLAGAEDFQKYVDSSKFVIKNRPDIYGGQVLMDAEDHVIGEEENLLLTSSNIGLYQLKDLAHRFDGMMIPAHIDREGNGLVSILGMPSKDMGFTAVELTRRAPDALRNKVTKEGYKVVYDSDAHDLGYLNDRDGMNYLELEKLSVEAIFKALK